MSDNTKYAPPPGSPPTSAPSYDAPSGPPPTSAPSYAAPSGPPSIAEPPPQASQPVQAARQAPDEPLPPYTAKATDPLPDWAQAGGPRFQDLSQTTPPGDPSRLPLDPPPECFSTPSPPRIRARSFAPFRIPSREHTLTGGFPLLWAPDELLPHGISERDWVRFLQDLGTAARLASQGLSIRGPQSGGPQVRVKLLAGNRGMAYDAAFVKSPVEEVQSLINVWNESALERRKVRASLHPKVDGSGRQKEGWDLLVEAL